MTADPIALGLRPAELADRRARLRGQVDGDVLLMGNGVRARNLPMTHLPFRQDSTFLYFTGCALPDAAALLADDGYTLFLPRPAPDDALWHGPTATLEELGAAHGADRALDLATLPDVLAGRDRVRTLAVPDESRNRWLTELLGVPLRFGREHGDPELVAAVIEQRRPRSASELDQMRLAAAHTRAAFEAVMAGTHAGDHERALAALFEGVLAARGLTTGYATILTQQGEVLHHHGHDLPLTAGRLLLLDGGGEVASGYGVDITRTWPVTGRFEPRQRAAYEAVLEAQTASIDRCRVGVRFREVHDASCRVLARFLLDEGLLRGSVDQVVETGAHALFFPHGVGHLLGLDVHDLENFGDLPAYPPGQGRPAQFGTENLRLDLPLEADWVVTVEPGFYVVPTILSDPTLRDRFSEVLDADRAAEWLGFGGIRIEDDVRITPTEPEVLTTVPKAVVEVEALVGSGPRAGTLLCSGS